MSSTRRSRSLKSRSDRSKAKPPATPSLTERRAVEDLVKQMRHLSSDLRRFGVVSLKETPNLHDLRRALVSLIDAAQGLEENIVAVSIEQASVA